MGVRLSLTFIQQSVRLVKLLLQNLKISLNYMVVILNFMKIYRQKNRELAEKLGVKSSPNFAFF